MAISDIETCLCLDDFAKIAGLTPPHFNGVSYEPAAWLSCHSCDTYFFQYPWQNSFFISRQEVAQAIASAEDTIENFLDAPLCPEQRCETFKYKSCCDNARLACHPFYRGTPSIGGYHLPDCPVFFWGEKMVTEIAEADVDYTIVQMTCAATGVTYDVPTMGCVAVPLDGFDPGEIRDCQFRLFFSGLCGDDTRRICPLKSVEVIPNVPGEGGALPYPEFTLGIDVAEICVDPWLLIDPALFDEWPSIDASTVGNEGCNLCAINGLDLDNYVAQVCVAYEWYDQTVPQVEFIWEPKQNCGCVCSQPECEICNPKTMPGCLVGDIRPDTQSVTVAPAEWDEEEQKWCAASWDACGCEPDYVRIKYWTVLTDKNCGPIDPCVTMFPSRELAMCIVDLATSRMDRPLCSCSCNPHGDSKNGRFARWEKLREDLTVSMTNEIKKFVPSELILNPLGVNHGEAEVYKKLKLIKKRMCKNDIRMTTF